MLSALPFEALANPFTRKKAARPRRHLPKSVALVRAWPKEVYRGHFKDLFDLSFERARRFPPEPAVRNSDMGNGWHYSQVQGPPR